MLVHFGIIMLLFITEPPMAGMPAAAVTEAAANANTAIPLNTLRIRLFSKRSDSDLGTAP